MFLKVVLSYLERKKNATIIFNRNRLLSLAICLHAEYSRLDEVVSFVSYRGRIFKW